MLKFTHILKGALAPGRILTFLAVCLFGLAPQSHAVTPGNSPALTQGQDPRFPVLDTKRLFALGMIETGNNDWMVGSAGEVSRYQLSPAVWKSYSKSYEYRNPEVSLQVARQHWLYLATYFKEKTGRVPTDFDMYVLWNTRYGYYAHKSFSKRLISPVVQDRAQRFVNLVYRKD
jgi:hypothetical protein